jgi:hypothetical protein
MTIDTSVCRPHLREAFVDALILSGWQRSAKEPSLFFWLNAEMPRC